MKKPVRLEVNNSGAWKVIGRPCLVTLRVSMAEPPHDVLMHWDSENEWRDERGEPA